MSPLVVGLLVIALQVASQELRAALDALRGGRPGESQFDAALPLLPDLIASRSGAFVAGGAHLAGAHGRVECAPALVEALRHENTRPPEQSNHSTAAILDALIRLEHAAPASVLLARPDADLSPQLFLALALEPNARARADALAQLVELGWTARPAHWAALCQLTEARDVRAFVELISGSPWELEYVVRDPGAFVLEPRTLGGGGWSTSHDMWPPRVQYSLRLPEADAALGEIEYERREYSRRGPLEKSFARYERVEWRARLLRELLGVAAEHDFAAEVVNGEHDYQDDETLKRALVLHVEALRARIASAAHAYSRVDPLEDLDRILARVRFRVRVHDLREDPPASLSLPDSTPTVGYALDE